MKHSKSLVLGLLLGMSLPANLAAEAQAQEAKARRGPAPDVKDERYGPHARNVLDLWKAKSDKPTPLVVYIHGGGFFAGDKSKLSPSLLQLCLKEGLSVASINYRLSGDAPFPAPMHDSARAIQFLRARAKEWNLDPAKIAATGESAGAGISLWLGFHDDLADPRSADPVARLSTRLTCMAVKGAQTSYDPRFWEKMGIRNPWDNVALAPFLGVKPEDRNTPRAHKLYEEASPITHVSADDPAAFLYYGGPSDPKARNRTGGHSPKFGEMLKEKLDPLRVECVLRYGDDYKDGNWQEAMHADMVKFFVKHFTRSPRQPAPPEEKRPQAPGLPGFKVERKKKNFEEWTYRDDQLVMFGILRKPEGDGPFPAIVLSHGGTSQAEDFGATKADEFVKWGFVCIAPYYTHGNFTKRADVQLPAGAKSAGEIKAGDRQGHERGASAENLRRASQCIDILESLPYVDKKRICAYGNSLGALLTVKLASQVPDRLAAVAITAGGIVEKQQRGDYPQGNPLAPGVVMPVVEDAQKIRTPFVIIHGGDDASVDPRCSALLKKVLDENRVPNERHVFEGVIHGVHKQKPEEVYRLIKDWFVMHDVLKGP